METEYPKEKAYVTVIAYIKQLVQDGQLVGAVTHVLVGTPAKGYGIFADTMLKMAETYNQ